MSGPLHITWPEQGEPTEHALLCSECFPTPIDQWRSDKPWEPTVSIWEDGAVRVHRRDGLAAVCGITFDVMSIRNFKAEP